MGPRCAWHYSRPLRLQERWGNVLTADLKPLLAKGDVLSKSGSSGSSSQSAHQESISRDPGAAHVTLRCDHGPVSLRAVSVALSEVMRPCCGYCFASDQYSTSSKNRYRPTTVYSPYRPQKANRRRQKSRVNSYFTVTTTNQYMCWHAPVAVAAFAIEARQATAVVGAVSNLVPLAVGARACPAPRTGATSVLCMRCK